jgi:hypothetical protein
MEQTMALKSRRVQLATTVVGLLLAVGVAAPAAAQTFELTPFAGWRFGGTFEELETGADLDLDESLSYGVILSIPWNDPPGSRVELIWSRQDTEVSGAGDGDPVLGLDVQYLHIGGMVPFKTPNDRLNTLISGGLGATYMRPGTDGAGSEVGFSLSAGVSRAFCREPRRPRNGSWSSRCNSPRELRMGGLRSNSCLSVSELLDSHDSYRHIGRCHRDARRSACDDAGDS